MCKIVLVGLAEISKTTTVTDALERDSAYGDVYMPALGTRYKCPTETRTQQDWTNIAGVIETKLS